MRLGLLKRRERRAFLLIEVIGATAIVILAAAIIWYGMDQYAVVRDEIDLRRSLRLVAQSELARLAVSDATVAPSAMGGAPPGITLQVTQSAADGEWRGFEKLAVRASATSRRGRPVVIELAVFRRPGEERK